MADTPTGRFLVEIHPDAKEQLRRFTGAARAAGTTPTFGRWLKQLDYRLRHEADEWGESREQFPGGRIEYRVGMVGDLTVWYGLDIGRAVVYVKRFRLRGDPEPGE